MKWQYDNIPDQSGRTAIVTGANAGIGYAAAKALAAKGARVIMACRSTARGTAALDELAADALPGTVELAQLDLSSLRSVREFASEVTANNTQLDLLINNAGVMVPPATKTEDGFELQIGVNFLGHFALTGLLLDTLEATPGSRVVTLSSLAHRGGRIDVDSFRDIDHYKPWREYQQSKLACLMFTLELQRRLEARGSAVRSLAAHPGGTKTDLQRHSGLFNAFASALGMRPDKGALPTLYAATNPDAKGGDYVGPRGVYEAWGYPTAAKISKRAKDAAVGAQLWNAAETFTGVAYLG